MEEWRLEFQFWRTPQEEDEEFAQTLCSEFQNWQTSEEEAIVYGDQFLNIYLAQLPVDVIKDIRSKVWEAITRAVLKKLNRERLIHHLGRLREPQCSEEILPFGAGQLPRNTQRFLRD